MNLSCLIFMKVLYYQLLIHFSECSTLECQCQAPYQIVNGNCVLAGCSKGEPCPTGAECITIAGGVSYCACPKGYRIKQDGSCEGENQYNSDEKPSPAKTYFRIIHYTHLQLHSHHYIFLSTFYILQGDGFITLL